MQVYVINAGGEEVRGTHYKFKGDPNEMGNASEENVSGSHDFYGCEENHGWKTTTSTRTIERERMLIGPPRQH